jgi:hypothetical protein
VDPAHRPGPLVAAANAAAKEVVVADNLQPTPELLKDEGTCALSKAAFSPGVFPLERQVAPLTGALTPAEPADLLW